MAELGEGVAVAIVQEVVVECPFSHEAGPHKEQNDLVNNPSKLGTNVGSGGEPTTITFNIRGKTHTMEVGFGAHHLIPGDAALNKATALKKWMEKVGKGDLKGDIGYGVNHENNGVWLPGNYRWNVGKYGKWVDLGNEGLFEVQFAYAYYAMKKTGKQFHDAHTDYSAWVRRTLEKIRVKVLEEKNGCDKCEEINSKKPYNPPYELVGILDGLSQRLRGYVTGPPGRWKPPFYTSRFAVLYGDGMTPEKMAGL